MLGCAGDHCDCHRGNIKQPLARECQEELVDRASMHKDVKQQLIRQRQES
jgi:hypothetical protein